jgi:hypothetical protein
MSRPQHLKESTGVLDFYIHEYYLYNYSLKSEIDLLPQKFTVAFRYELAENAVLSCLRRLTATESFKTSKFLKQFKTIIGEFSFAIRPFDQDLNGNLENINEALLIFRKYLNNFLKPAVNATIDYHELSLSDYISHFRLILSGLSAKAGKFEAVLRDIIELEEGLEVSEYLPSLIKLNNLVVHFQRFQKDTLSTLEFMENLLSDANNYFHLN